MGAKYIEIQGGYKITNNIFDDLLNVPKYPQELGILFDDLKSILFNDTISCNTFYIFLKYTKFLSKTPSRTSQSRYKPQYIDIP